MAIRLFKPFVMRRRSLFPMAPAHNIRTPKKMVEKLQTEGLWDGCWRILIKEHPVSAEPCSYAAGLVSGFLNPILVEVRPLSFILLLYRVQHLKLRRGDQMAVHLPLSVNTGWCRFLLLSPNNLLNLLTAA